MNIAVLTDPTPSLYYPLRAPKTVRFWIGTLLGDAMRTGRGAHLILFPPLRISRPAAVDLFDI